MISSHLSLLSLSDLADAPPLTRSCRPASHLHLVGHRPLPISLHLHLHLELDEIHCHLLLSPPLSARPHLLALSRPFDLASRGWNRPITDGPILFFPRRFQALSQVRFLQPDLILGPTDSNTKRNQPIPYSIILTCTCLPFM